MEHDIPEAFEAARTLRELFVLPKHGQRWGVWRFDAETLELVFVDGGYPVDLERLSSPNEIADWVAHLMCKTWVTPQIIGDFLFALNDLTGACDRWPDNPTEAIRSRYRKATA